MKLPAVKKQLRTRAELEAFIQRQHPGTWEAITIHNCVNGHLLKAAIEKIKTGGVLALYDGDMRILTEIFDARWTHYFCRDGDVIWTRICRREGSSEISLQEEPLAFYMDLLRRGVPFSYLRYGDGEWNCALETLCPGYGFQDFTPALRKDVQASLIEYHKDPQYVMGLPPVRHFRDRGLVMWELINAFLREHDLNIEWSCSEAFNRASWTGKMWPFVQYLQQHNVVIVGPARYKALGRLFPKASFVVIPPKHCHAQLAAIQKDVLAQKLPAIISITAGPACVALIYKLWPHIGDSSTMIDIGSMWAPYIGQTEHGAHVNMLKIQGLMDRNVGKFE